MQRRFIALSLLMTAIWSLSFLHGSTAFAHAFVIGSDPIDGSTISAPPAIMRIFFDAPLGIASTAHVFGPNGNMVDIAPSIIPHTNSRELDTSLTKKLLDGSYTVRWTALSHDDGHTTHGVIGFNIGHSSTGLPGETILGPSTSNSLPQFDLLGCLSIAWEWLVLATLTIWIGMLVIEECVIKRTTQTLPLLVHLQKRTLPLQYFCLSALLIGESITLVLRALSLTQELGGANIDPGRFGQILTSTNYGYFWLIRFVLIAGLLLWGVYQQRNTYKRQHKMSELIVAGLILLTYACSSDAIKLTQAHISTVMLSWLYIATRSVWLGGLFYLGYMLLPLIPVLEADHSVEIIPLLIRRCQPIFLAAISVVLVSGLYLGELSIQNTQQLVSNPYGLALLGDWTLFALMLGCFTYTAYLLHATRATSRSKIVGRGLSQPNAKQMMQRITQIYVVQIWLGAGMLLCAAMMAFFAPPIVFPAFATAPSTIQTPATNTSRTQTQQIDNLSVMLEVFPGRAHEANSVLIHVTDSSNMPVSDAQIQLNINMQTMNMGAAQATVKGGFPNYIATFERGTAFSMPGIWNVTVNIQRPHYRSVQGIFQVML